MEIDRLKLKKILLDNKISQKQIGLEIGVSGAVVSSWFTRGVLPDQYVIHIKKLLNIDSTNDFERTTDFSENQKKKPNRMLDCAHYEQRILDLESNLKDKQVIIDLLQQQLTDLRHFAKTAQ